MEELDEDTLYRNEIRSALRRIGRDKPNWRSGKKFPSGLDPFAEIYSEKIIAEIYPRLDLPDEVSEHDLRNMCASAAYHVISRTNSLGSPCAKSHSKKWSTRLAKQTDKLLALLDESQKYYASNHYTDETGKTRVTFATSLLEKAELTAKHLRELREMVPLKEDLKTNLPTKKYYYLQVSVFAMSVVFCRIYGASEMKRIVDGNVIYGLFYDFVSRVTPPLVAFLMPDIVEGASGKMELDTYIKTAAKYKSLFGMDRTAQK